MKDKREMIGKALGPMMPEALVTPEGRIAFNAAIIRLAKQAIVIECGVIQGAALVSKRPETEIHLDADSLHEYSETYLMLWGHPLPEGKAIAIIVPLADE